MYCIVVSLIIASLIKSTFSIYSIYTSDPAHYPSHSIYVDSVSGSDSNSGSSPQSAVQTIAKALSIAPTNGQGSTIILANGVYRETITSPNPASMAATGPIVVKSASGDSSKVSIRCSNSIVGSSLKPLSSLSTSISSNFQSSAQPNIYVADLASLGWSLKDLLRLRDDANWEQKAAGLNFLVQSSVGSNSLALNVSNRYVSARAPNFKNVTNWKRAEYWWKADGPTAGSTTQLVDATSDVTPADILPGNLKTIGADMTGAYVRALDGLNSHWVWYRRIRSHDQTSGTITIDDPNSSGNWGSCDSSTGVCTGCEPLYACGDANADTNGMGFSDRTKYYIDNHPYLLDSPGEYYVDKNNLLLFLIPPSNVVVDSSFVVELSKRRIGIDITNTVNMTFDSINVEMCDDTALWANDYSFTNTQRVTIRNSNIQLSGRGLTVIKSIGSSDQAENLPYTEHISVLHNAFHHIDDVFLNVNQGWWGCSISSNGYICERAGIRNIYIGHNQFYEVGFQPFGDDGSGASVSGNLMVFENNVVRNVAHNGIEFIPGEVKQGSIYPFKNSDLLIGSVLIKDNIFEWTCLLESDCGGLKHWSGSLGFRDHLVIGNVFRNIVGWSLAWEVQNQIPSSWAYYNPITRAYWATMLGFAFGSYFDYAPGSFHYRNIAYNIGLNCYQWTNRIAEMEFYFHNNLAVNCYDGLAANWDVTNSGSGEYGVQPTYGHVDSSVRGNIFAAVARNGLQLFRSDQSNGIPRSFAGNYYMDYNIWYRVGYDNRTDSVYRRGLVDIGYQTQTANGGNPTATLSGLQAYERNVSVHDIYGTPQFTGFNVDVYCNSVISRSQAATLTSYITDNNVDWTAFTLRKSSPAVDKLPSLPAELVRVMNMWNIKDQVMGSSLDIGPLESGVNWTAAMKGPQPASSPVTVPVGIPTLAPTYRTMQPSGLPIRQSLIPTVTPSSQPSNIPTSSPAAKPSTIPTIKPTTSPTSLPSLMPSVLPTKSPTSAPSVSPTTESAPSSTHKPSLIPTAAPSVSPSSKPTSTPTMSPTSKPSPIPTLAPTTSPTPSNVSKLPQSTYSIYTSDPANYPSYSIYVDPVSGSDSNSGSSPQSAVQTIAKALSIAPTNGQGSTIILANGVYRETITSPNPASMAATGPIVVKSASGDSSKVSIRCSNSIVGSSLKPLSSLSTSISSNFQSSAQPNIYVADLASLGWSLKDLLRLRDDANWEQKAAGLNFLVQSSVGSNSLALNVSNRYVSARAPNFKNVTNWKRAEYWWKADGPTAGSTTQLVDATSDVTPADILPGNLKTIGADMTGAYVRALDGLNSHWVWYRRIRSHDQTSGTITIDDPNSSGNWGSCDSSTGVCTGCEPLYACGDANADTNGMGFSDRTKYYIDNHPYLLDSPGEYYVDKNNLLLFLIPPSNVVVDSSFVVELSKRRIGIDITNTVNMTFDSINVEMCDDTALWANDYSFTNTQRVTIRNSNIQLSGRGLTVIKSIGSSDQAENLPYTEHISVLHNAFHHIDDVFLNVNQGWWGCSISSNGYICERAGIRNIYIGHNQFYEVGFQPFGDDGSGASVSGNLMVFENNVVRNVAHNGIEFIPGEVKQGSIYPFKNSDLLIGSVLIKDNIFEWTCLLESDCGGLKHWSGSLGFRDHLVIGNVFRNIVGWSLAWEVQNQIPSSWAYYNPITRAYWATMLGFAFGSYFDYAPGSFHYRNIAYNIGLNCYQWTNRIAEMEFYFHNNLAVNCYDGLAANWDVTNSGSGEYGVQPTYGHVDSSVRGNIFAAVARNGLQLFRSDQSNGIPRSFAGNYYMDYNIWYRVGYDNRTDSVYRRGLVDIGYQTQTANGGNPTATLSGLQAYERNVSVHDIYGTPQFTGFNVDVYCNSVISRSQAATLTSYITDNNVDWTAFTLRKSSPAVDKLPSLPAELVRVMNMWNIKDQVMGSSLDIGPLESGVNWTAAMKGPQPASSPVTVPVGIPTLAPTYRTMQPSGLPIRQSLIPTVTPSSQPSNIPTSSPAAKPSTIPTIKPTTSPTSLPSLMPSVLPTKSPTSPPSYPHSFSPTRSPTTIPSAVPLTAPTLLPTSKPSMTPTISPSVPPISVPSLVPTSSPTISPTSAPNNPPTAAPTSSPTSKPSIVPTASPTVSPSANPSREPSASPTSFISKPSITPTVSPTLSPTALPSDIPTMLPTSKPSLIPTISPSSPTSRPSPMPTTKSTKLPTNVPSVKPTSSLTTSPSSKLSTTPTTTPSVKPSLIPTAIPSVSPTSAPSMIPTIKPTTSPTVVPSLIPTSAPTPIPSPKPSLMPTVKPTTPPTYQPSLMPTTIPSTLPTLKPSLTPTTKPTTSPTAVPSLIPTAKPTASPTTIPSLQPTKTPTKSPTSKPSLRPTTTPTTSPSFKPSITPTTMPSSKPSLIPTGKPTISPSSQPTIRPTSSPTTRPSMTPTTKV